MSCCCEAGQLASKEVGLLFGGSNDLAHFSGVLEHQRSRPAGHWPVKERKREHCERQPRHLSPQSDQFSLQGYTAQRLAGQGRAGQGRAGQGRAGQGTAGQGRAGQGRAGQQAHLDLATVLNAAPLTAELGGSLQRSKASPPTPGGKGMSQANTECVGYCPRCKRRNGLPEGARGGVEGKVGLPEPPGSPATVDAPETLSTFSINDVSVKALKRLPI
ncbi:MAG: hypothetical protein FRX49_01002 [Trebouxia sp. A1-2]|nr:MAG: hypothetical protein FRX49_01002 [Trebouxia sp. A1-2]